MVVTHPCPGCEKPTTEPICPACTLAYLRRDAAKQRALDVARRSGVSGDGALSPQGSIASGPTDPSPSRDLDNEAVLNAAADAVPGPGRSPELLGLPREPEAAGA